MQRQVRHPTHAIHPALAIAAPGMLAGGTALDTLAAGRDGVLTWMAFWMIAAGVASGAWCAAWALLDGIFFAGHGTGGAYPLNALATATVVGLFGLAVLLRLDSPAHSAPAKAMAIEVVATALLGIKAWVGGELGAWLAR